MIYNLIFNLCKWILIREMFILSVRCVSFYFTLSSLHLIYAMFISLLLRHRHRHHHHDCITIALRCLLEYFIAYILLGKGKSACIFFSSHLLSSSAVMLRLPHLISVQICDHAEVLFVCRIFTFSQFNLVANREWNRVFPFHFECKHHHKLWQIV